MTNSDTLKGSDLFRQLIIDKADDFLSQKEIKNNQGFQWAFMDKLMRTSGFINGYAWCQIYTEMVYKQAILALQTKTSKTYGELWKEVTELITPSTQQTWNNFSRSKLFERTQVPKLGDIMIFVNAKNNTTGHAAIVVKVIDAHTVETIEGNTNDSGSREGDGVYRKIRKIESDGVGLDLKGFISVKNF